VQGVTLYLELVDLANDAVGEKQLKSVKDGVTAAEWVEVTDSPASATHIVVSNMRRADALHLKAPHAELCSVLWLCASLEANRPLVPAAHPLYRPFRDQAVPGTAAGVACISGFLGLRRRLAILLLKCMGYIVDLTYREDAREGTATTTLLLVNDLNDTGMKLEAAR
jgi:hypothetical protein